MILVLIKALKDKCIVVQCVEERQYIFISIQEYMLHFEPKDIYQRSPNTKQCGFYVSCNTNVIIS